MHIKHDKSLQSASLKVGDFSTDNVYSFIQLKNQFVKVLLEARQPILLHCFFGLYRPEGTGDGKNGLSLPRDDPLVPRCLGVVVMRLLDPVSYRLEHDILDLDQPVLDLAFARDWVDHSDKLDQLTFYRVHAVNLLLIVKVQLGDTFEALLQVGLHSEWLLGLRQDFQQLFVGTVCERHHT